MTSQTQMKTIETSVRACLIDWVTDPASRTVTLKKLAEALVELRSEYTRNGAPDWAGRSFEYRAQVSKLMKSTGLDEGERKKIVGLLRYHIGNQLRELVPAEELTRAGLRTDSPRERVLNAKGQYRTVDTAVQRLMEAVSSLQKAPGDDFSDDHLATILEASRTLGELVDEHSPKVALL